MAGNLALLLNGIGLAVSFTILLVTANTMSMAVRERRTEIAVLKTLGFPSAHVMGLVVAEAVALGVLGGALGIGASQGLMWVLSSTPGISTAAGIAQRSQPEQMVARRFRVDILWASRGFVPALPDRSRITDMREGLMGCNLYNCATAERGRSRVAVSGIASWSRSSTSSCVPGLRFRDARDGSEQNAWWCTRVGLRVTSWIPIDQKNLITHGTWSSPRRRRRPLVSPEIVVVTEPKAEASHHVTLRG